MTGVPKSVYLRSHVTACFFGTPPDPQDKTIKLWRVREQPAAYCSAPPSDAGASLSRRTLRLPTREGASGAQGLVAHSRRTLEHAHAFHINSVSPNCDGETFISADDLRINLWNFEVCNESFST